MTLDRPFKNYEERLLRVLTYVYDHLDEELSLDKLADIACISRYHWHRVFKAMTGETLADTVRRLRLSKAANTLLQEDRSVREVAQRFGYKNLASFSRAFKNAHGVSPNKFREIGIEITNLKNSNEKNKNMYPVKIQEFNEICAAGVLHSGPYHKIGTAFKDLGSVLMANSLMEQVNELFVIYHDPPASKPSSEFRSHVAVSINKEFPNNIGTLEYFSVVGGRFAVLEHTGPYANLKTAYDWFYGTWLPQSGYEPRDAPPLEVYVNDPKTTPSTELRTDIRLPLI